ncbi:hypothetical protein DB32_002377 [Sandaracinus amylolyticus]|uniref:Uncharacterized protein n=1 Tax=Sandaracinus amylolyticus TaxID=927083 RepID=A0A0F6YHX3_9BACT|nr:hypothetical protein DB32_002377 [Sandaracinus amylolyticus]
MRPRAGVRPGARFRRAAPESAHFERRRSNSHLVAGRATNALPRCRDRRAVGLPRSRWCRPWSERRARPRAPSRRGA